MCAITGNVGQPGTGLHPLRGQNNVQGASDAGLIPMFYPDYQRSTTRPRARGSRRRGARELDAEARADRHRDRSAAALKGGVRGMYMMGENPFLSDPNINKVRKALAALEFLVVQDIFLTETAEFADVVLPATSYLEKDGTYTNTDRRVQIGRKVLDPPGEAREDWEIICDIATPDRAADGLRARRARSSTRWCALMPDYAGLSYDNLGRPASSTRTRTRSTRDGTVVLFDERFATDDGKAHLVPAEWMPAQGAAGRGVPVRAQHRPAARALAHRLDDPPLVRARRDPARGARSS